MIKYCAGPLDRRVARFAGLWEAGRNVVWIRSLLEVGKMARRARRSKPGEFSTDVATRAGRGRVFPGQGKLRRAVIKYCAGPLRRRVA